MRYTVYILFSKTLNRFYIGFTGDFLENKVKKHNSNHKGFTGKATDWQIKHSEVYITKEEAMQREKQLKSWKSAIRINELIQRSSSE